MGASNSISRIVLPAMLAALSATTAMPQGLEPVSRVYDFGVFKEAAGPKTGIMKLVNRGSETAVVMQVRPSCGCTDADFSKESVNPGDSAWVSFTYNPAGRPGKFEKTVKVVTSDSPSPKVITIKGTVIGMPSTLEKSYPYEAGPLRLSEKMLVAGRIPYGQARHMFIKAYNQSADTIRPAWRGLPEGLNGGISDREIGPGDIATFSFYYNTRDTGQAGRYELPFTIMADTTAGAANHEIEMQLIADVLPQGGDLSPQQLAEAPRIAAGPLTIDLGIIKGNKTRHTDLVLANEGHGELNISRIYSPDSQAIKARRWPARLKGGKSGTATIDIDPAKIPAGAFRFKIDVASSDPLRPIMSISICGQKEN